MNPEQIGAGREAKARERRRRPKREQDGAPPRLARMARSKSPHVVRAAGFYICD